MKPMVRNNICLNAHPAGCARETRTQVEYVLARRVSYEKTASRPSAVLVLGSSTGYGLASRIAAAFGFRVPTVGVSFEKEPSATKVGTPGWYNTRAFEAAATAAGIPFRSLLGDAFSRATKAEVIATARGLGLRFDLVVYSLASPVRVDPDSGHMYRSVIKPLGGTYRGTTVDVFSGVLSEAEIRPATAEEAEETVKVMGGEDWALWIDALRDADVLASGALTIAYSYLGPALSWPIYRDGTIGAAKAHLEASAREITARHADRGSRALVSINKAIVTRASAVIPVIPLYVSTLYKVMKARGTHEDCVAQADRLFRERLYGVAGGEASPGGRPAGPGATVPGGIPLDAEGRIRIDDLEMADAVQAEVEARMAHIDAGNVRAMSDIDGFRDDFLRIHGFSVPGIDYGAEIAPDWDPFGKDVQ